MKHPETQKHKNYMYFVDNPKRNNQVKCKARTQFWWTSIVNDYFLVLKECFKPFSQNS